MKRSRVRDALKALVLRRRKAPSAPRSPGSLVDRLALRISDALFPVNASGNNRSVR